MQLLPCAERYELEGVLGKGGIGVVYRARDTHLDLPVVAKTARGEAAPEAISAIRCEAYTQSALNGDHRIPRVFDLVEIEGMPAIVMEYVAGRSVDAYIGDDDRGRSPLTDAQIARVYRESLAVLTSIHARGIVHRDVKPGNILLADDGNVHLLDFGSAWVLGSTEGRPVATSGLEYVRGHQSRDEGFSGTLQYMSPEQIHMAVGGDEIDGRSDLFSLGVAVYELVTQVAPFRKPNQFATLFAIEDTETNLEACLEGEFRSRDSLLMRMVARSVDRLMQKDPDRRPDSAREALSALERDLQRF